MSTWKTKDGAWKTRVVVLSQERYDAGAFNFGASYDDGTLDAVIASLAAIRDSIPEEYRAAARCGIDSTSGYEDSHYATIEVSYDRPATDEEIAAVVAREQASAAAVQAKELADFERLKAKFAPLPTMDERQ